MSEQDDIHNNVSNDEINNDVTIYVQRHTKYNRGHQIGIAGNITEEGIKYTQQRTKQRLNQIPIDELERTSFLIIGSPTPWLSEQDFGKRAEQTGSIIKKCIEQHLRENGIGVNGRIIQRFPKKLRGRIAKALQEPTIYDTRPKEIKRLKLKNSGMNKGFYKDLVMSMKQCDDGQISEYTQFDDEQINEYTQKKRRLSEYTQRKKMFGKALKTILDFGKNYHNNGTQHVCAFLVTHGEILKIITNKEESEWEYNDGVIFKLNNTGKISATVDTEQQQCDYREWSR